MKTAQTVDGLPLTADETSPEQALCPHCSGIVHLRRRKLMNGRGYAYYWRHQANQNRNCPGRSRNN
jgi:hypothetical protein